MPSKYVCLVSNQFLAVDLKSSPSSFQLKSATEFSRKTPGFMKRVRVVVETPALHVWQQLIKILF